MVQKHLEIKTYEWREVNVMVKIDYDKKEISLIEKKWSNSVHSETPDFVNKAYVFVNRGLEYMQGWQNVLDAIGYAIESASNELKGYLAQVEKEKIDTMGEILDIANEMVKKGKVKQTIKNIKQGARDAKKK